MNQTLRSLRAFSSRDITSKICIVGAGPAGFYTAQYLQRRLTPFCKAEIDIYDKFPVPFGLVRYGVAPDHPNVKNVQNTFSKTASLPNVRFIGNVALGKDISLNELREAYHVVVLTYGADENKVLDIPGEHSPNCIPARRIVGWYNGLPDDRNLPINLENVRKVAIFGNGNVAVDVARMFLTPIKDLMRTDTTEYALEALSKSRIDTVYLVGRRGPLQAAFTIKELREMLNLENCNTKWRQNDFEDINQELIDTLKRPRRRLTELMLTSLNKNNLSQNGGFRSFNPIFLRSPLEITEKNVELSINKLEKPTLINQTSLKESLDIDLVITSIGYKSIQVDSTIPFDTNKGIVLNTKGRIDRGVYSSGWLATGPVGVLVTTMNDAFACAELILHDLVKEKLTESGSKEGFERVLKVLGGKQLVEWKDWLKIDEKERVEGEKRGKPREKIVDIEEMLKIAA